MFNLIMLIIIIKNGFVNCYGNYIDSRRKP